MRELAETEVEPEDLDSLPDDDKPLREKSAKLPKVKNKTLTPEDFYEYTKKLKPEDWAHVMIYVYRQWPVIVRDPANIDTPTAAIDETYMLREHGSGKYWLMLNDTDRKITHCQTYPIIDNPLHPPKLTSLHELDTNNPKNRAFVNLLKRQGKLNMNGDVVEQKQAETATDGIAAMAQALKEVALANANKKEGSGLEGAAFTKMMDMMSTASSKSIEIAMSQVKTDNPQAFMTMMTGMMGMFEKMMPKQQSADDSPVIKLMMAQLEGMRAELSDARRRSDTLMEKLIEKREGPEPLDMIDKVLGIRDRFADMSGEGGARNWKEQAVQMLAPHAPLLVQALGSVFASRPMPAAPAVQPQTIDTTAQPVTQQPQQQEQPPVSNDPLDELRKTLTQYAQFVWNKFSSWVNSEGQQLGSTGYDFAQLLVTVAGKPEYDRIRNLGAENIIAAFNTTPALQSHFAGLQPQLAEWIADFVAFGDPEEEPPLEETPTPAKGGRKK